MPLSVETRLVHIKAETPPSGAAAAGYVIFVRDFPLYDSTGDLVQLPAKGERRYVATLGTTDDRDDPTPALGDGEAYIALPVNDQAGITPQDWVWTVSVRFTGWTDEGSLAVPSGGSDAEFADDYVSGAAPAPAPGDTYATTGQLTAEAAARAAADAAHAADTTSVHGITDTSVLETTTGAAAKVAAHSADTTDVHGIADTGALETTTGSTAKVTAHAGASDPHGDRAFSVARANHTGTQSADTLTDGVTNAAFLATERTKLAGIATGATANSSDATLLARANHTGTQLAATISDFTAAALAIQGDQYAAGQHFPPRAIVTTAGALTSGGLRLTYFTAVRAETWAALATVVGGTGAGATPTLCRMGLYSVAANGDITLVASCANDTTLWATPSTRYSRSLSVAYPTVAGGRYAFGELIVTGAALPNLMCADPLLPASMLSTAPRLAGLVTGQTDLPASVLAGSITDSGFLVFGEVLTA